MNKAYLMMALSLMFTTTHAMENLTEKEMSNITGKSSYSEDLLTIPTQKDLENNPLSIMKLLNPMNNLFTAEKVITGVTYHEGVQQISFNSNGGLVMNFPKQIELLEFNNIQLRNSIDGSIGSIHLKNIEFSKDSHITITYH
jgi:hypothetical protein